MCPRYQEEWSVSTLLSPTEGTKCVYSSYLIMLILINFLCCAQWYLQDVSEAMQAFIYGDSSEIKVVNYFLETSHECSLPSIVLKNKIKKIGNHARKRDMMGQYYPIYVCCGIYHVRHFISPDYILW